MKNPPRENRPNKLWPFACKVEMVDAWGFNPVNGTVIGHYNQVDILVEDIKGVRHFGQTWRITTPPPGEGQFDDLLGDIPAPPPKPKTYDFEDLLG